MGALAEILDERRQSSDIALLQTDTKQTREQAAREGITDPGTPERYRRRIADGELIVSEGVRQMPYDGRSKPQTTRERIEECVAAGMTETSEIATACKLPYSTVYWHLYESSNIKGPILGQSPSAEPIRAAEAPSLPVPVPRPEYADCTECGLRRICGPQVQVASARAKVDETAKALPPEIRLVLNVSCKFMGRGNG